MACCVEVNVCEVIVSSEYILVYVDMHLSVGGDKVGVCFVCSVIAWVWARCQRRIPPVVHVVSLCDGCGRVM